MDNAFPATADRRLVTLLRYRRGSAKPLPPKTVLSQPAPRDAGGLITIKWVRVGYTRFLSARQHGSLI